MGGLAFGIELGPRSLLPLFGAGLQLALALFLFLKPGERRVRLWFAVAAVCAGLWSTAYAVQYATHRPALANLAARVAFASIAMAGCCALQFGAALARVQTRLTTILLWFAACVCGVILAFPSLTVIVERSDGVYWPGPSWSVLLAALVGLPGIVTGQLIVRQAWRELPPCRRRRQLGWGWAALVIGVLGTLDVVTLFWPAYPIAWATSSLSSMALFYAIVQHRLMAIRTFVRQTLIGALATLSVAALAYGVLHAIAHVSPVSRLNLVVAVVALFVIERVWVAGVEPALNHWLGWRRRRIERAWAAFARRSLDARTPAEVETQLSQALKEAFDADLLAVLPAGRHRIDERPLLKEVEAILTARVRPLLRDLIDLDDPAAPPLLAALKLLQADALLPLGREGELVAIAAVSGRALSPADDALSDDLERLSQQAALAWVNATLYHEVARRSANLENEVRLRTAELENALDELRSAQARLVEAERSSSLGLLVAGVSHEINNALNFIYANLPTLSRYVDGFEPLLEAAERAGALEPELARRAALARSVLPRAIHALGDATRRTRAIVDDLRKFARPDAERRLVRVEEGLDAALNLLRRRTDGRLDVVRAYGGAPSIDGYPGPLNQCFFNLLMNAVEAASSQIWVAVHGGPEGVQVVIADDGLGVPVDLREQVFRPFFTTKPKAAGLGLTVSRDVVERHGGTIELDSAPGAGATVRVRLPLRAPEPAPKKAPTEVPVAAS